MKFFINIDIENFDTDSDEIKKLAEADITNLNEIKKLAEAGLLAGVATDISSQIIKGKANTCYIKEVYQLIKCPMIVKCTSSYYDDMLKEGQELAEINKNIIVAVPSSQDGLRTCKTLTKQKIQTLTSCYSRTQALLVAKTGATYVSIDAQALLSARLEDIYNPIPADNNISGNRISFIEDIIDIYKKLEIKTQILLTSINGFEQVEPAARIGIHAVAISWPMFSNIIPTRFNR